MRKNPRFLGPFWLAWGISLCLICVSIAAADDISPTDSNSFDDNSNGLPPAGLTGWFFTSNNPPPYPVETDPGQPWTSPDNIATLNYWLGLVAQLQNDPSLLWELYGLGMICAPDAAAVAAAESSVSRTLLADQPIGSQNQGGVPEPATLMLLGGSFVLTGLFVWARRRPIRLLLRRPPHRHSLFFRDGSL